MHVAGQFALSVPLDIKLGQMAPSVHAEIQRGGVRRDRLVKIFNMSTSTSASHKSSMPEANKCHQVHVCSRL